MEFQVFPALHFGTSVEVDSHAEVCLKPCIGDILEVTCQGLAGEMLKTCSRHAKTMRSVSLTVLPEGREHEHVPINLVHG